MDSGFLLFMMFVLIGAVFIGLYVWVRKDNDKKAIKAKIAMPAVNSFQCSPPIVNATQVNGKSREDYFYYTIPPESVPNVVHGGYYEGYTPNWFSSGPGSQMGYSLFDDNPSLVYNP